jgi:hypothetical protein
MKILRPSLCSTTPVRPSPSRSCRSYKTARSFDVLAMKRSPVSFSLPNRTLFSGPVLLCMMVSEFQGLIAPGNARLGLWPTVFHWSKIGFIRPKPVLQAG